MDKAVKYLSDAEVEEEIARLEKSPLVKRGRSIEKNKYRRREKLYKLRRYERVGREAEGDSGDEEDPL